MAFESDVNVSAVAVTAAEAVVATLPQIAEQIPNPDGVIISGEVNYSPAATATAITLRVRQGNAVAGALVGVAEVETVANPNSYSVPYEQLFPAGAALPYGNQFCLTAQGTTAGGTINNATISARSVTPAGGP